LTLIFLVRAIALNCRAGQDMSGNAVSRTCGCCQTPTPWGFWPSAWADSRDMSTRLKEIGADAGLRRLGLAFGAEVVPLASGSAGVDEWPSRCLGFCR